VSAQGRPGSLSLPRWLGRGALVLLGLALALLVAELGLRIAASQHRRVAEAGRGSEAFDLLCVGDSFTYGLGSEDGRGYPEQLQALLDERWGPGAATIHNRGRPGQNSSQAADALADQLAALQPELVVILVGHNNGWNYNDLHLDEHESLGPAGLWGRLRVVRLLRLAVGWDLDERRGAALDEADAAWFRWQGAREKERKGLRERAHWEAILAAHPDDVLALLRLAEISEAPEREALLARARARDPDAVRRLQEAQQRIDAWHQEQEGRGEADYLARSPDSRARLLEAVGGSGDEPHERRYDRQQALLDEVLRRDLRAMVEASRRAGAEVVLMGYPTPTKQASPALEAAAAELGLPFVDQQARFDALLAQGRPLAELFVLDGHCTSEGYRVMAEALLPAVEAAR
jgi:lysophospholipase L1-like esterase